MPFANARRPWPGPTAATNPKLFPRSHCASDSRQPSAASALARADRTTPVPSRAGVPHLGGHRWRRVAVRVLLHQADHHLPRLPVRTAPAPVSPRLSAADILPSARAPPRRARRTRAALSRALRGHRARRASEPRSRVPRTEHGRTARLTSSPSSRDGFPFRSTALLSARRATQRVQGRPRRGCPRGQGA